MTQHDHWRTSPYANEFLPEEIERLERGTMELCEECLWPRPVEGSCGNYQTVRVDQDRDGLDDLPDLA